VSISVDEEVLLSKASVNCVFEKAFEVCGDLLTIIGVMISFGRLSIVCKENDERFEKL
jgi:hypothetical protein